MTTSLEALLAILVKKQVLSHSEAVEILEQDWYSNLEDLEIGGTQ
jgi:hypothetical protein